MTLERKNQRGAAMVETVICLLVLVPIFMFAIFLDDLLRYRLDLQEAVTSTTWDTAYQDWNDPANVESQIGYFARVMWCDHTSAYDSYDYNYDCEGEAHHDKSALAAHVCWLHKDAAQVRCDQPDKAIGANYLHPGPTAINDTYTKGGMVSCDGKVAVLNYFLPKVLYGEFSQVKNRDGETGGMTDRESYDEGDPKHNTAKNAKADAVWVLKEQKFAILNDPWALNTTQNLNPDKKDDWDKQAYNKKPPLLARTSTVFKSNYSYTLYQIAAKAFPIALYELVGPYADDMSEPSIGINHGGNFSHQIESEKKGSYQTTAFRDWDQDMPKKTYEKRGDYYLGCDTEEGC